MNKIIVVLLISIFSIQIHSQESIEQINAEVHQRKIRAHLEFLASDALNGRETGSPGIEAAAAYLGSQLKLYGLDTFSTMGNYRQNMTFTKLTPPGSSSLKIGQQSFSFPDDFILLNGDKRQMKSQGQFVKFGTTADLKDIELRLKIMVSFCGDGQSSDVGSWLGQAAEKRKLAIEKGAIGLIEIYRNSTVPWRFIKRMATQNQTVLADPGEKESTIPHIWIGLEDSSAMSTLMQDNPTIEFDLEGIERTRMESANIVGWVKGSDPILSKEYVVYSAHYDHVGAGRPDETGDAIYNGARDNAVGTTAVLMLAQYMSRHPTKRSSIFVFFTAEEKGLLGSRWFVENSPVPLNKIDYCFNIDNGGYNDTSVVSVIGLTRTEAQGSIEESCQAFGLQAIEDPAKEQGLFDRSDNVNFAKKGIPAPTFSLGFRSFDAEIFKYYHQPSDEVGSLDFNYLEKYVKSYILSAIKIGNMNKSPFWNIGDKYYEAGMKLYNLKE